MDFPKTIRYTKTLVTPTTLAFVSFLFQTKDLRTTGNPHDNKALHNLQLFRQNTKNYTICNTLYIKQLWGWQCWSNSSYRRNKAMGGNLKEAQDLPNPHNPWYAGKSPVPWRQHTLRKTVDFLQSWQPLQNTLTYCPTTAQGKGQHEISGKEHKWSPGKNCLPSLH